MHRAFSPAPVYNFVAGELVVSMKAFPASKRAVWAALFCSALASGQIAPDVAEKLHSPDWREREQGYRAIAAEKNRSPEEDTALVALLAKEISVPFPPQNPQGDALYPWDPLYVGALETTVMEIADRNPERADVWPTLLLAENYNGFSAKMPLFAKHADKTAPYFLAAARGEILTPPGSDPLGGLAKIVAWERDPTKEHHLTEAEVLVLEKTIRDKLSDPDEDVRMDAVQALGMVGDGSDLETLDRLAETDPGYDPGLTGYPVRVEAREAAGWIRKRLAAAEKAKQ